MEAGHELKMVWPANTKRNVLCKSVIDQLKETGKLSLSTKIEPALAKTTFTNNPDTEPESSTSTRQGRGARNIDNPENKPARCSHEFGKTTVSENDVTGSNILPSMPMIKKKKRHQWNTPRRSPKDRPNMRKKRHIEKQ